MHIITCFIHKNLKFNEHEIPDLVSLDCFDDLQKTKEGMVSRNFFW